ncbi:hypothetical protein [Goodfellowiella coeruleoviolacea]|uniref:Uncharacterized protein n=1 Tax=Goodfellowiella coeruleoviolacea TaxID=334858 RepID=A0AAE3GLW1_9PSEU|nr:hypothetical protein [Goodfellowiella coeruleoviolacea]MCP2169887.1 hypothetical protein [Goodfellowiella coeruleoviolacea]
MKAWIERQPDGRLTIEIDTKADPRAQVLYDLLRDVHPEPEFLVDGAEQARNPGRITADNEPFFDGDMTLAQVIPDGVVVENIYTENKVFLSHGDFIDFVETYLRLLALRKKEKEGKGGANGQTE